MPWGSLRALSGLDQAVFRLVNGWPDQWAPLFVTLSEGNKWWPVRIFLAAVLVWLLARREDRLPAALAMASWPVANAATDVLKASIPFERPSGLVARLVESGVPLGDALREAGGLALRVEPLGSMGTASAHSANMAAVATCFVLARRPHAPVWAALALLTGVSRVYVGVHYPSQVLLGWAVGAFTGWVVWQTAQAWRRLRASSPGP
jgi:undecaprenyl-diphosphatase